MLDPHYRFVVAPLEKTQQRFFVFKPFSLTKKNLKVGGGGFEPPKAVPADLQSVPFGHSGIRPFEPFPDQKPIGGLEPSTC